MVTNNNDDTKEVRRRECIARKYKSITNTTKKRLPHTLIFSIASYSSERWVLKNRDKKKIEAFDILRKNDIASDYY